MLPGGSQDEGGQQDAGGGGSGVGRYMYKPHGRTISSMGKLYPLSCMTEGHDGGAMGI